jgi:hypothetical protein
MNPLRIKPQSGTNYQRTARLYWKIYMKVKIFTLYYLILSILFENVKSIFTLFGGKYIAENFIQAFD